MLLHLNTSFMKLNLKRYDRCIKKMINKKIRDEAANQAIYSFTYTFQQRSTLIYLLHSSGQLNTDSHGGVGKQIQEEVELSRKQIE